MWTVFSPATRKYTCKYFIIWFWRVSVVCVQATSFKISLIKSLNNATLVFISMFALILDFIVKSLSSRGNVAREGRGRAICAKGWHRKQTTEGESRGATMHRTIDTSYRYRATIQLSIRHEALRNISFITQHVATNLCIHCRRRDKRREDSYR